MGMLLVKVDVSIATERRAPGIEKKVECHAEISRFSEGLHGCLVHRWHDEVGAVD